MRSFFASPYYMENKSYLYADMARQMAGQMERNYAPDTQLPEARAGGQGQ